MTINRPGSGGLAALAVAATLAACGTTAAPPGSPAGRSSATTAAAPSTVSSPGSRVVPVPVPVQVPVSHASTAAARSVPAGATVAVGTARGYGRYLVDGAGRTLYLFTADRPGTSVCAGACAAAWPPLIVRGAPRAGTGIGGGRLSVVRRAGNQMQAAYLGRPLYYYVGDRQPGQILCQDVEEYGGHWWLVGPGGLPNRSTP